MRDKQSQKYIALLLIVVAAIAGGGVASLAKIALREIPPLTFTFFRFLSVGIFLIPAFLSKKQKIKLKDLKNLVLVSFLATSNVTFFVLGVERTTATIAQMLYAAVPIIAGIFSYLLLKEKITIKKLVGVLLGFFGVLTIILLPVIGENSVFNGNLIGNLLIFIAVSSFSLYTVLSKRYQKKYTPLTLTVIFIITTICIQAFLAPTELKSNPNWWRKVSLTGVLGLAYVGIIGTGFYYLLYQYTIKKATPVIASMILYLQPIFSFIWAFFLLRERLTFGFIVGSMLAFIGAGLVTSSKN